MPDLVALAAFLSLAVLSVLGILRVPPPRPRAARTIDLRDAPAGTGALRVRLVLVRPGLPGVTIDGLAADGSGLVTLEVERPEGWEWDQADALLQAWAAADAVVEVRRHERAAGGARVWMSAGDAALDLPLVELAVHRSDPSSGRISRHRP